MKDIYNYLLVLEKILIENDFQKLDDFLIHIYTWEISEQNLDLIYDILNEVTLYLEYKDENYKTEALKLINVLKENNKI